MVIGAFAAFSIVVGGELYRSNSIAGLWEAPASIATNCVTFLMVFAIASIALSCLFPLVGHIEWERHKPVPDVLSSKRAFFVTWALIFLLWLPCLLAYWPGPFSYDIPTQTNYVFSGSWTTQQPPLHTLIWALFLNLEGFMGFRAITWYCLGSMAFLSGCFSYALSFIAKRRINRWLWVGSFAFFALNPVVALFAITPVKDSLLAGFLLLFVLASNSMLTTSGKKLPTSQIALVIVSATACCLLRANMLVAFALYAIVLVLVYRKSALRNVALVAIPLAIALVVSGPIYSAVGIKAGSSAIASVPFQQIVNVVAHHKDELSEEEIATVEAVLPVDKAVAQYNPRFADKVVRLFKGKSTGTAAMRDQLIALGIQWLGWIPRYPLQNVDAFLDLNLPYWYPFAQTPDPYSQRAYIETFVWKDAQDYHVGLQSKLEGLHALYEDVADFSAFAGTPVSLLFSPSTVIWVLLLCLSCLYCSGRRRRSLVLLLPLLFWLSFMIGPVSNMRYVFPLFSLYPIALCFALQPCQLTEGEERKA